MSSLTSAGGRFVPATGLFLRARTAARSRQRLSEAFHQIHDLRVAWFHVLDQVRFLPFELRLDDLHQVLAVLVVEAGHGRAMAGAEALAGALDLDIAIVDFGQQPLMEVTNQRLGAAQRARQLRARAAPATADTAQSARKVWMRFSEGPWSHATNRSYMRPR